MDGLAKIDRDELVRRMRADFEQTLRAVADAVNDAPPDGHLIDGSEERVRDLLGQLLARPFDELWQTLVETRATLRATAKRRAMDDLMRYLGERREQVNYAAFRAAGLDIGSGPTESMCKSLGRRMKGIGMRWTPANAEAVVALEALHQSQLWSAYWSTRLVA